MGRGGRRALPLKYPQAGPLRCRSCRGKVNTFTSRCFACGETWVSLRHRSGQARYEPDPPPSAPAVALAFPDFDDLPLGGAA